MDTMNVVNESVVGATIAPMATNRVVRAEPPAPRPDTERITATRRDADMRHSLGATQPTPDPDPDWVTLTRSDADSRYGVQMSEPSPERDSTPVTESRGEAAQGVVAVVLTPIPEPDRETAVRGEDSRSHDTSWTYVRGEGADEESRTRGEDALGANSTGTFSRGESDDDLGRHDGFRYNPLSTETKRDRGDVDFNAALDFDPGDDDEADARRITPLGIIAARQSAAARQ
jgi:hypothetical protein